MFDTATRLKLRFPTNKGNVSVEDLWDLPLTSKSGCDLDNTAKTVNAHLKASEEESFVSTSHNPERDTLDLQLKIVKHIIAVKLRENEERLARAGRKTEKDRLIAILENKQQQKMEEQTEEQILARIAELDRKI